MGAPAVAGEVVLVGEPCGVADLGEDRAHRDEGELSRMRKGDAV